MGFVTILLYLMKAIYALIEYTSNNILLLYIGKTVLVKQCVFIDNNFII